VLYCGIVAKLAGLLRSLTKGIPAWFDEGVAVIVSDDRRYLGPVGLPDRCLISSDEPLPSGMLQWNRRAGEHDSHIYAEAACRVSQWMYGRGGSEAVANLILMVSNGTPFSQAYR